MGLRKVAMLVRPTAHSLAWTPLASGGALALALLALTDQGLTELRLAGIGICVGAAFILDDAAAVTVAYSPTTLLARRSLRIALALAPLAALSALLSWFAGSAASLGVSLELAAMLAVTLAAAAIAARIRGDGRGGVAAGPALLTLLAAAFLLLPPRWGLFPAVPRDPSWTAAHQRWALILLAGVLCLLRASRSPARKRWTPRTPSTAQALCLDKHRRKENDRCSLTKG